MGRSYPTSLYISCLLLAAITTLNPCEAAITTMTTANITTKKGCPRQCGNVTIPYPFGIGLDAGCSLDPTYDVHCEPSFNPPTPFLMGWDKDLGRRMFEILEISEDRIRIRNQLGSRCFNSSGHQTSRELGELFVVSLAPGSPFIFSSTSNKLVAIGCADNAFIFDRMKPSNAGPISTSCNAECSSKNEVVAGQCNGVGCCEASLPRRLRSATVTLGIQSNNTNVASFNPCGYVFIAEKERFTFGGASDLNDPKFEDRVMATVPVVIDWAISNGTCAQAQKNATAYACMGNTTCVDNLETGIGGYRCTCSSGYQGNPYLSPGCSDVDECADPGLSNCSIACHNTVGSFRCSCPPDYIGDGRKNGSGCTKITSQNSVLKLGFGISSGLLFLVVGLSWLYVMDRKRKLIKMKHKFFEQNGGWLLQDQLSEDKTGRMEQTKIFTEKDLSTATNSFANDRILGTGGFGTVYKGILPNNQVVAIKRSKLVDKSQIEQFINEIVILGQVNHRNVVKLLGCCLETEVPLLVYEFITEGTLHSHFHGDNDDGERSWKLTWRDCLSIASGIADALAYLHSAAAKPIIHRDIKSENILLDVDKNAKIADFGISRLIPKDQSQISTLVQGTMGYLDPEYFQSSVLTEKSDVYSFGVVLAEILTRQRPISVFRAENERSLSMYFIRSFEEETLLDIVDPQWVSEASTWEVMDVAWLTKRCLNLYGKDRPSMREVYVELEAIRNGKKQSRENQMKEGETTMLLHYYQTINAVDDNVLTIDEEKDLYTVGMFEHVQIIR